MRPPKLIKPYVMTFARQVTGAEDSLPFYVPAAPLKGAPHNECFAVVQAQVAQQGGSRVIGWAIWERPGVYLEAEFHAVWRTDEGRYLDIAPRTIRIPRVLFLPDPRRQHTGAQVDNVRKALVKDRDVDALFAAAKARFRLLNEGHLKHQTGKVAVSAEVLVHEQEMARLSEKIPRRYGPWLPEERLP